MIRRFKFLLWTFLALLALVVVGFRARSTWLPWLASPLIYDEGPAKADIAVVLAGDVSGGRIDKASSLVRQGYVPLVLVSGPPLYGRAESDVAIEFAVRKGDPPEWFVSLPHSAPSTKEEAEYVLTELRRRNVHRFLLVTSNYHTARAARIFRASERASGGGPEMRVVASEDLHFHVKSWWLDREGQKLFFTEWCKEFANVVGI